MSLWARRNWYRVAVHVGALLPLLWIISRYAEDSESFTINRDVELLSGALGLLMIVASFSCTPLSRLLGVPQLTQIRRALGLYGFLYICIHIGVYAWFDNQLDFELMLRDLGERRAMSIGLLAFALLVPLALTSTRGWQRRLGRNWRVLHRLVYFAVPLSVLHFLLLDRDILTVPLIYAAVVTLLLAMRLQMLRRKPARV